MAENDMSPSRRTVIFTGTVQGVGFRYTARMVAQSYQVTGTVRNLPGGCVEMIAEGLPAELTRFQAAVEEAMHGNIRDAAATDGPATGEFTTFDISF